MRTLFALTLLLVAGAAVADVLTGRVVGVGDGDTITVLDEARQQHRIRLAGIDAPEKAQSFGNRSKQHLSDLVFARPVTVEWHKADRYGRKVGKVMVAEPTCVEATCPQNIDAGLAQVTAGLAWWYRQYAREQRPEDRALYEAREVDAMAARVGLWSQREPMAPWDWRRSTRRADAAHST